MSGTRKGRTGLEWLLEEPPAPSPEGDPAAGTPASPPPSAPEPFDVGGALEGMELAPSVDSPPPAGILGLPLPEARPSPATPPGAAPAGSADEVAGALAVAEAALHEAAKTTDEAADAVADRLIGKFPAAGANGRAAAAPAVSMGQAIAAAEAAVRAAARATDAAADDVAEDLIVRGASRDARPEPAPEEVDLAAPGSTKANVSPGLASHRKAVTSGKSTRAHPRAEVRFEVRFRKGSDGLVAAGRNLSMGGFFVETTRLLPEGEVFQAQLVFPARAGRKLSVIAEVMWGTTGEPEDLERLPPGMGCKFLDVDDKDAPFIQEVVDEVLAKG